jgi:2-haloacid dehalogenase
MTPIIVFDVNETLLDLAPVRNWFADRFGNEPNAAMWFGELLRLSFVSAATGQYVPFPELATSALATSAERFGASIGDGDVSHIGGVLTTLPAHADVPEGLGLLGDSGFSLVALTNSPLQTANTQLTNARIAHLFDSIMSVEMVGRFKPHHSVYEAAATALGVTTSELVMVAAHDWDIAGSMVAGCDGVFVSRPGQLYSPSFAPPTLHSTDICDAARKNIPTNT